MLCIAFFGVVAAFATIVVTLHLAAGSGKDTNAAIAQMKAIATSMTLERPAIERQAKAAADAAQAAKDSASAARGQEVAIIRQAEALVGSAKATVDATAAQLSAAQANMRMAEAGVRAAELQQKSAELVAAGRKPVAVLSNVEIQVWFDAADSEGNLKLRVRPKYSNIGGATLLPGITVFNFAVGDSFYQDMLEMRFHAFGGNENPIKPNDQFYPTKMIDVVVKKADVDAVRSGQKVVFVWGNVTFSDTSGNRYRSCYYDVVMAPTAEDAGGAVMPFSVPSRDCPHP
ncbi:hypothetical protein [Sphingobium sp.]|uniref:hypothetical protein n=1 Tax=Sphingobium sp. TaxID=1912891 RepID=UPI003B3A0D32